jgi:hypothetical protein
MHHGQLAVHSGEAGRVLALGFRRGARAASHGDCIAQFQGFIGGSAECVSRTLVVCEVVCCDKLHKLMLK